MVARPLATPVTIPASVTVATFGASVRHPDMTFCGWPPPSVADPVAWADSPMRTGLLTVTLTAVADGVADDGPVGVEPDDSPPQAATVQVSATDETHRVTRRNELASASLRSSTRIRRCGRGAVLACSIVVLHCPRCKRLDDRLTGLG